MVVDLAGFSTHPEVSSVLKYKDVGEWTIVDLNPHIPSRGLNITLSSGAYHVKTCHIYQGISHCCGTSEVVVQSASFPVFECNGPSKCRATSSASLTMADTNTIETWIFVPDSTDYSLLFDMTYSGVHEKLYLKLAAHAGELALWSIPVTNRIIDASEVKLDQWNHFASVDTGSTLITYINGVQIDSVAFPGLKSTSNLLCFGCDVLNTLAIGSPNLAVGSKAAIWRQYATAKTSAEVLTMSQVFPPRTDMEASNEFIFDEVCPLTNSGFTVSSQFL
eukprot:TRINITY_DN19460_c0_g1_i1.p1 TRINITY_DN19460_c0_g1~~TRINITY_DN19460_c0_g1_i1.p1  ORF type:complete len:277 (-),score=12.61 TRINITY_DN19460_c0_g1_i1:46-876(-)